MAKKLFISDEMMLRLMKFCIDNKIKGVQTQKDFLLMIDFPSPNNVKYIREGTNSFQKEHIKKACDVFGIDANYFYRQGHQMYFEGKKISPIIMIKQALELMETAKSLKQ